MGLRFRKSFKIAPGVRINLSKTGISTSIGPRGATMNFRGRQRRTTIGIPGSGLSHTSETRLDDTPRRNYSAWWLVVVGTLVILGVARCAT